MDLEWSKEVDGKKLAEIVGDEVSKFSARHSVRNFTWKGGSVDLYTQRLGDDDSLVESHTGKEFAVAAVNRKNILRGNEEPVYSWKVRIDYRESYTCLDVRFTNGVGYKKEFDELNRNILLAIRDSDE